MSTGSRSLLALRRRAASSPSISPASAGPRRQAGPPASAPTGSSSVDFSRVGGYLALAEAAAEPSRVAALVLVSPAVPTPLGTRIDPRVLAFFFGTSLPFLGRALLRLRAIRGPEVAVRDLMALCCVDSSRIGREVFDAHVELARERAVQGSESRRAFLEAQRSLLWRLVRRRRFLRMIRGIEARALIVQGERDRLVRLAAARALASARPDWRLAILDDVGHVPQLEAPDRFLAEVASFLDLTGP
ncbi:MAG: alpha/beta hydrolase [Deltaproteobacteria bacterium]|nr:MAG: alpha/beta hydrolase [Deltaproteobacteria bacterium]